MSTVNDIRKILVRTPNWVGDAVMATPALRCIRENFPTAEITWLTRDPCYQVYQGCNWFDELLRYSPKTDHRGLRGHFKLIRQLRERGPFDLCFLMPNSFQSALIAVLAGTRERIGYKRDARALLLTQGIDRLHKNGRFVPRYMGDYYLELCRAVGCEIRDRSVQLFVTAQGEEVADQLIGTNDEENHPLVLLCPAAAFGPSKLWYSDRFAAVADRLIERYRAKIAIAGAPSDLAVAREIAGLVRGRALLLPEHRVDLNAFKSIVRRAALMITLDAGPRHFAVAFRRPVITLMGPNDPRYTDTGQEIGTLIRAALPCIPCQRKTCPRGDRACMDAIQVDEVVKAAERILSGTSTL